MNGARTEAACLAASERAIRMGPSFTAWRILDNGEACPERLFAATLPEIERELANEGTHQHRYVVRETDPINGKATLHFYTIRKGAWKGHYSHNRARKVYPYTADRLLSMKVNAFDPVEPWRWTPGCDVVGIDRDLVEQRS